MHPKELYNITRFAFEPTSEPDEPEKQAIDGRLPNIRGLRGRVDLDRRRV